MEVQDRKSFTFGLAYAVRRRWMMMAVTFLIVMFLFLFAGYLLTPTWEAEVLLLVEQPTQPPSTPFTLPSTPPDASRATESLAIALEGKGLAYDMVRAFGLDERLRLSRQQPATFRDKTKVFVMSIVMSPITFLEWVGFREPGEIDWVDEAAEDFRSGLLSWLDVEAVEDSQVVSLKINGETPELAMNIANAMVRRLRERLVEASAQAGEAVREAYRDELVSAQEKLNEAEAELQAFQEAQGGGTLSEEARANTLKLQELKAESSRLRGEILVLGRQLEEAGRNSDTLASINSETVTRSAVVQGLRANLHSEEVRLAVLAAELTPEHPDVINLNEEIAGLRGALREEIVNVQSGLVSDEARLREEIAELETGLLTLPARELLLAERVLAVDTYRQIYRDLLQTSEKMEVMTEFGIAPLDFKVLDYAQVSPLASSDMPPWAIVLVVAIVAGAGTAFGLVLFLEYWRDPIKTPSDLRRHDIDVLGVVPRIPRLSSSAQ